MLQPDFKQFSRLAREATLVPVVKSVSADLLTPVSAFLAIAEKEPHAFLLESIERGEQIGRYTFLGARPYMRIRASAGRVEVERNGRAEKRPGNVFQVVKETLRAHRLAAVPGLPPFTAGAVGYFAYDVVRQLENIGERANDDLGLPDAELMFFDRLLAFDHLRHQIHIMAAADVSRESPRRAYDRAVRDIAAIEKKLASGLRPGLWRKSTSAKSTTSKAAKLKIHSGTSRDHFLRSVERCKEYIAAGDIFQVVLSQRLDFKPEVAPFDLYRALRQVNPSPYLYFLDFGGFAVAGSSPEILVKSSGGKVTIRPIAGTRRRGATPHEDQALEAELLADPKERAEHLMLLDLGRNDVGRVADIGTVKVTDQFFIERYSQVMHIVSNVEGKLRKDRDAIDALAAGFPAGTVSGAPKVRAMQIIDELEKEKRSLYAGCVGYFSAGADMDTCIVLRTALIKDGTMYVQAGAGIVADSDPQFEQQECINKAKALFRAAEEAKRFASAVRRGQ